MLNGILDERLQYEIGNERFRRSRLYVDACVEPTAEPHSLDAQIALEQLDAFAKRDFVRLPARTQSARPGLSRWAPKPELRSRGSMSAGTVACGGVPCERIPGAQSTTRSRPNRFATYSASSARARSACPTQGSLTCSAAMPTLTVTRPWPRVVMK